MRGVPRPSSASVRAGDNPLDVVRCDKCWNRLANELAAIDGATAAPRPRPRPKQRRVGRAGGVPQVPQGGARHAHQLRRLGESHYRSHASQRGAAPLLVAGSDALRTLGVCRRHDRSPGQWARTVAR